MTKQFRIGIEALSALPAKSPGLWVHTRNLVEEIARLDTQNQYFIFCNHLAATDWALDCPNVHLVGSVVGRSIAVRLAYQNAALPFRIRSRRLDLLHSIGNYGTLWPSSRSVVTVHDLIPLLNLGPRAGHGSGLRAKTLSFLIERSVRRASLVMVNSNFTKGQLIVRYPSVAPKVRVVYHGLPNRQTPSESEIQSVLARHAVRKPYLLSVGLYFPHKNIQRLIQAFALLKEGRSLPHQLVLVGEPGANRANLQAAVAQAGVQDSVVFTGFVSDAEVAALYGVADLFAMPSLMEGFGFPVLEAMRSRIPVVCSNAGSLPEVAGDAAALFDPTDVEDMARAIREVLHSPVLRERLIAAGLKRVQRFSFRRTAEDTLNLYREVMELKESPGGNNRG
jgi:glycosyltransferase involved in cell wall biosynthesis